ncbi:flavodoxin family protein [Anaerolentibacter hominis]|uniref:flavodoxin family protein n=1 Tax=Anaerolentibacter hominis TaxID=3079009 RepID=UPI0031B81F17
MKLSVVYYSKTGKTKEMAEVIAAGMEKIAGIETGVFDISHMDEAFIGESRAVIVGTPTWHANPCWQIKKFLDGSGKLKLKGKIGGAFATADHAQGGADMAISVILTHLMVDGMLVYSGGSALGQPFIHLGPVALKENFEKSRDMFEIFGTRIAEKAKELFPEE